MKDIIKQCMRVPANYIFYLKLAPLKKLKISYTMA